MMGMEEELNKRRIIHTPMLHLVTAVVTDFPVYIYRTFISSHYFPKQSVQTALFRTLAIDI